MKMGFYCLLESHIESLNYRMALVGRDLKDHQVPTPHYRRQGCQSPHFILDQAAQGPILPGFEHLQGQSIHSLSGQPVPAPHHSRGKELMGWEPEFSIYNDLLSMKFLSMKWHILHLLEHVTLVIPVTPP